MAPWNKGKKTGISYWKGKKMSEETKKKMSASSRRLSPWLGKKFTQEHREAISKGFEKSGRKKTKYPYGRTSLIWKNWRKAIMLRDKGMCQLCLTDVGTICSHHIIPSRANHSIMFEVSNGVALCRKCHADLHNFSLLTKKAMNSGKVNLLKNLLKALDNPEPTQDGLSYLGGCNDYKVSPNNNPCTSLAPEREDIV